MHLIYRECQSNATAAAVIYRERYSTACYPDYRVVIRMHRCYSEARISSGGVDGISTGRNANNNTQEIVIDEIQHEPSTSTSVIAKRTGISKTTVPRVLKKK